MKIILSSRGIENEKVKETFLNLLNEKKIIKVIIITTASVEFKEKNKNAVLSKQQFEELGFVVQFLDIEFENPEILNNADVIYINGGNPYYLLHHFKQKGIKKYIEKAIKRDSLIIGWSAGAFVLTKSIEIVDLFTPEQNIVDIKDKNALNLVNCEIIPHYNKFIESELLIVKYEEAKSINIIRINDNDAFIIENDKKYFVQ